MKKALAIYGAMAVVALAAFAARAKTEQLTSTDRQRVQALVNKADQAWNAHDASLAAKDYTADATLLGTDGKLSRGQQQIEQELSNLFQGPLANAQNKFTILSMQRVGPNEILLDLRQQLTGIDLSKAQPPGVGGAGQQGTTGGTSDAEQMQEQQQDQQLGEGQGGAGQAGMMGTPGSQTQAEQGHDGLQTQQPMQSTTETNHVTVLLKQEGNQLKMAAVRAFPEPGTGGAGMAGSCPGMQMRQGQGGAGMNCPCPGMQGQGQGGAGMQGAGTCPCPEMQGQGGSGTMGQGAPQPPTGADQNVPTPPRSRQQSGQPEP